MKKMIGLFGIEEGKVTKEYLRNSNYRCFTGLGHSRVPAEFYPHLVERLVNQGATTGPDMG
jgi:hypothetical protein